MGEWGYVGDEGNKKSELISTYGVGLFYKENVTNYLTSTAMTYKTRDIDFIYVSLFILI